MKSPQISNIFNNLVLIYLITILIFSWTGVIAFGHGLGDMIYAGGLFIIIFIHAIATWIITQTKSEFIKKISFWIIGSIFLLLAIYYTYGFTVGRGGEYPWNGNPFFEKSFRFNY